MASLPTLLPLPQCIVNFKTDDDETVLLYPIVPLSELCQMRANERSAFLGLVTLLFLAALVGNVCTLYVNARRKLRPFFRACLIALACSDLLYSLSFTTAYVAHFSATYLELWVRSEEEGEREREMLLLPFPCSLWAASCAALCRLSTLPPSWPAAWYWWPLLWIVIWPYSVSGAAYGIQVVASVPARWVASVVPPCFVVYHFSSSPTRSTSIYSSRRISSWSWSWRSSCSWPPSVWACKWVRGREQWLGGAGTTLLPNQLCCCCCWHVLPLILSAKQFAFLFIHTRYMDTLIHTRTGSTTRARTGYHWYLQRGAAGSHLSALHRGICVPQCDHSTPAVAATSPTAAAGPIWSPGTATFCACAQSTGDHLRHADRLLGGCLHGEVAASADTRKGKGSEDAPLERRSGGTCRPASPHGACGYPDDGCLHFPASACLDLSTAATLRQLLLAYGLAALLRLRPAQSDQQRPQSALLHISRRDHARDHAAQAGTEAAALLLLQQPQWGWGCGCGHAAGAGSRSAVLPVLAWSTHHMALPAPLGWGTRWDRWDVARSRAQGEYL